MIKVCFIATSSRRILIVNEQLDLWVTDFGVAKAIEEESST